MKEINFISACSDLGVHVCGSENGPLELTPNFNIKNYIVNDKPNYDNNISKFGYMLSNNLEKFIQTSIETTFEFVSKILE